MRKYFVIALVLLSFSLRAQTAPATPDTTIVYELKGVQVTAPWKNDTERYHYNQMKFYVTTILPYLNAATTLFTEINMKLQEDLSRRERKQYIGTKEDEVRTKFEDKVRDLNVTQGVLLVKLIARQTNMNIYDMLRDFKGTIPALKWQTWARLHGLNLDRKYHPEEEPWLELIMDELGYPLPHSYVVNNQ